MKSVLISIQPKWCEKIMSGEKTIEVRKSAPKEVPFKCYIYCTKESEIIWAGAFGDRGKWNGHIIGEFICDKVIHIQAYRDRECIFHLTNMDEYDLHKTCLKPYELYNYLANCGTNTNIAYNGCLWHISDLKIYDKPKELSEFSKVGFGHIVPLKRPNNWQYVEEI